MRKIQPHKTAIHRKKPSHTVKTIEKSGIIKNRIFDFGCGTGSDVNFLKSKKYKVSYWDPHFYPKNPPSNFISHSFQTIFCTYILNVISKKDRMAAIKKIQGLLHKNGKAFFTVRTSSDILEKARKNKWKKKEDGWITKRGTFQKGFKPNELELLLKKNGFQNTQTVSLNPLIVEGSMINAS